MILRSYSDLLIINPVQAGINKAIVLDSATKTHTIVDYDYGYPASTFRNKLLILTFF